jgi:hypothetical protein
MLYKFKPSVEKKYLILISGLLWSAAGIILNWIAIKLMPQLSIIQIVATYILGIMLGFTITKFGFSKLAIKNALRINSYPESVCVFAFQRWQMYLLIVFMMSLGIFMRSTSLIPKYLLAPMYVGIGTALIISSGVYYQNYSKVNAGNEIT